MERLVQAAVVLRAVLGLPQLHTRRQPRPQGGGRDGGRARLDDLPRTTPWATLARNECGISRDDVAEALNHARRGSDRVTDIYIERDFTRVWEANRKVLDLVGGCYFFAKK